MTINSSSLRSIAVALCLAAVASAPSFAFELKDHEAITLQAIRELKDCYPGVITDSAARDLVRGNLNEDLDLITKWTEYSHYYNPDRALAMRRKGSLDRIKDLARSIEAVSSSAATADAAVTLAGQVIHHLQDSAVPPHALPIQHWLSDGFERFERGAIPPPTSEESTCAQFAPTAGGDLSRNLQELLRDSARDTLKAANGSFTARDASAPHASSTLAWTLFWKDGTGDRFGEYGSCGNAFGRAAVACGSKNYLVDRGIYRDFKRRQVRQAIQATKKALVWILFRGRRNDSIAALSDDRRTAQGISRFMSGKSFDAAPIHP